MRLTEFTHINTELLYNPASPSNSSKRLERHHKQIEQEEMYELNLPFHLQSREHKQSIGWDEQTENELLRFEADKARKKLAKKEIQKTKHEKLRAYARDLEITVQNLLAVKGF